MLQPNLPTIQILEEPGAQVRSYQALALPKQHNESKDTDTKEE